MEKTLHSLSFGDSRKISSIKNNSIDLILTSPPYPMIQMWDELFSGYSPAIKKALDTSDGPQAFDLIHDELDNVWRESFRVLKNGGFACINIGDATRTIGDTFRLFPNHSRILESCSRAGFEVLPMILWKKSTNAPNKFMGSGMLPAGAYVTLEHEYILILRKNGKRTFSNESEKKRRRESALFWEERNTWFSDIWEIGGARQQIEKADIRKRSAAFPFHLAYRLIAMYSVRGDIVLDPFCGTGTTVYTAMGLCRNSIGIDIDDTILSVFGEDLDLFLGRINGYTEKRILDHWEFVESREAVGGTLRHTNIHYGFPVMTSQEKELILYFIEDYTDLGGNRFQCTYSRKTGFKRSKQEPEQTGWLFPGTGT
ncbi:MAG: site-specific DNA-methyltransferase [Spirochaetales bacterium]|nr:site-specific DNA-methyltransferase [Spirochaetales bacterium]